MTREVARESPPVMVTSDAPLLEGCRLDPFLTAVGDVNGRALDGHMWMRDVVAKAAAREDASRWKKDHP